ncbi:DUF2911 domain-containing protein [Cellulophaga sp. E16_2]|uniref:Asparagine synthetase B n=1 Tax=Cellulophaga algicola (strain DSM 14237 / IC166 / ACAM 630) TaxID=688270 RepID=E6XBM0_CELAD|nr:MULTISPECIES: DUF2911 domain-containing protein [Cellulophaga]ADV47855.1 hypothetical protein Celal_0516 [Cellulophaga algicola DSM 14237]MBO0590310.1 DUF2911 domain-containing protein [Cellulophaga sp. E16_2]
MKKILTLSAVIVCLVFTTTASAQKFSGLDKSPMDVAAYPTSYKVAEKIAKVSYSRPQLKGRSIAELAPAGAVWRTGANEAVEVTFYKDVTFGGSAVKAGTYSLFTIPGAKEWTVILNSKLNQWGAYSYDESADIVRVKGTVSSGSESLDAFSIAFKESDKSADLVIGWGTVRVAVPVATTM